CKMPIFENDKDVMRWKLTPHGNFSTSSAWNHIRAGKTKRQLLGSLWCPQITPTISVFLWRLVHNWIPVDSRLQRKGFALASKCFCCNSSSESIPHVFIYGKQAREVWSHFTVLFKIPQPQTKNPIILIQSWRISTHFSAQPHIRFLIPVLILWSLWTERNDAKYRSKGFHHQRVIWKVYYHIFVFLNAGNLTGTFGERHGGCFTTGGSLTFGENKKNDENHLAKTSSGMVQT
ncbi:hypothetical protein Pfo_007600, partial [Paulownia fortunei]